MGESTHAQTLSDIQESEQSAPYSETAAVVERPVCCVQELKGLGQPPEPSACPDIPMGQGQESS